MKRIINCETGEVIERQLTTEELAQQATDEVEIAQAESNAQTQAAARQALLDKLGITEEEAKLLLS